MTNSLLRILILAAGLVALWVGAAPAAPKAQQAKPPLAEIKPPLHGLIGMGNTAFHRHDDQLPDNSLKYVYAKPGTLNGVTLNFTWAQLQPKPNDITTQAIDRALQQVRAYNAKYPKRPLGVRLRVYAGPNAPQWVKRLGGKPVKIQYAGVDLTIARFWHPKYAVAWRYLQQELAKKYDAEPLINEVAMTSCSSVTSEPMVFAGGPVSLKAMHKAGFTDGKYRKCLAGAPDDYIFWQNTRVEFPISLFRHSDGGVLQPSRKHTLDVMRRWRKAFGRHGVLSNHTLQSPAPKHLSFLFEAMQDLGPLLEFQMEAPSGVDWGASIQYGKTLGATAIELWPETILSFSARQLRQWSAEIKRNPIPQ